LYYLTSDRLNTKSLETNLLYILPDSDAGVASVVRNLLRFHDKSIKTTVVLLHDELNTTKNRINNLSCDNLVRLEYNSKWSNQAKINKRIKKLISRETIIISNDGGVELEALKSIEHPIRVVYVCHGDIQHYYRAIKKHKQIISYCIAVSQVIASKITDILDDETFKNKISKIYFPVPQPETLNRKESNTIRLVFVGSLIKAKGVLLLPKIVDGLQSLDINYHLTIIGSGAEENKLKQELGGNRNISFKGRLPNEEILKIHQDQDVILLPSHNEGLPVVLIEAMKCGVVPLASNIPSGIPEIVIDSKTGYKINIGDAERYCKIIHKLYRDHSELNRLSNNCKQFSASNFDPYNQTRQYEYIYENKADYIEIQPNLWSKVISYIPFGILYKVKKVLN